MPTLTHEMIEAAIHGFESQKQHIDAQIAELRAMLSPGTQVPASSSQPAGQKKRRMSAAGRRAIAVAQRKRWASLKTESAAPAPAKEKKRTLSPEGRANIVAALKKRWAVKKAAAGKKTASARKAA